MSFVNEIFRIISIQTQNNSNFYRKEESESFPIVKQITVQNVLGFILANLNRPTRLNAMVSVLKYSAAHKSSLDNGLKILQNEIENAITYNLYVWRRMPTRRKYILRRLQALKILYLALYRVRGNESDFNYLKQLVKNTLNVWIKDEI